MGLALAPYWGALLSLPLVYALQEAGYYGGRLSPRVYVIAAAAIMLAAVPTLARTLVSRGFLRITREEIVLPRSGLMAREERIRARDLRSYLRAGQGSSTRVHFAWAGPFSARSYGPCSFVDPCGLDRLHAAMSRALDDHPELDQVLLRGALIERLRRPPRLCLAIALALALVYCWQLAESTHGWEVRALLSGALSPWLVWHQGEWFRLATGPLLHGGVLHLALNLFSFIAVGLLVEPVLGRWRLLLVIAASAAVSSTASSIASQSFASVGFSGAVFGVVGAAVAVAIRFHRSMANGWQAGMYVLLFTVFSVVSQWLQMPIVDHVAHVAGLATGVALGLVLGSERALRTGAHGQSWALVAIVAIACSVWLLAAARAVQYRETHDLATLLRELDGNPNVGRGSRRLRYASVLAVAALGNDRMGVEELGRARALLADAIERGRPEAGSFAALAAIEYTLGSPRAAVGFARESLGLTRGDPQADLIAQLSLYEWASDSAGATYGGRGDAGVGAALLPTVVDDAPGTGDVLTLTSPIAHSKGLLAHVLVLEGEVLRGFLRLRLGPFSGGRRHFAAGWSEVRGERELSYRVTYLDRLDEGLRPGAREWRYWPWNPHSVASLEARAAALRASVRSLQGADRDETPSLRGSHRTASYRGFPTPKKRRQIPSTARCGISLCMSGSISTPLPMM
jgi:membrane associated rhomboid family serine protease